jgi:hypothetical protein
VLQRRAAAAQLATTYTSLGTDVKKVRLHDVAQELAQPQTPQLKLHADRLFAACRCMMPARVLEPQGWRMCSHQYKRWHEDKHKETCGYIL